MRKSLIMLFQLFKKKPIQVSLEKQRGKINELVSTKDYSKGGLLITDLETMIRA